MKITDFGISKRTRTETFATYDDPNKIPFKWLPPEVLKSREMTPKTDVWSYGVLMHELYGIGEPYGMMGAEKVVHALNGEEF
ncbi:hypothetical protein ANCCAN_19881 [Ancylostoma caninum]|uniref:Protein kinase domain-containing protein n=1 Tax=Ancylostoma caninum TaxID=29170 RepID=A0A368FPV5_ANCCA|nr:hypothetical protein ANCCAN_19881 [Ancylostoma caninum]